MSLSILINDEVTDVCDKNLRHLSIVTSTVDCDSISHDRLLLDCLHYMCYIFLGWLNSYNEVILHVFGVVMIASDQFD